MKYKIVTSLNAKLWQKFMHKTVGSIVDKYKGTDQQIDLWFDTPEDAQAVCEPLELTENFIAKALTQAPMFVDFIRKFDGGIPFKERGIDPEKIDPGHVFRFNYVPFAKKVYSWVMSYMELEEGDVLVWIDGDVIVHRKLEDQDFEQFLPEGFDISFLDRDRPWYAAETGFFMIRRNQNSDSFVSFIQHAYQSGFIFDMAEWHDGFLFKVFLKMCPSIRCLNLNPVLKERDVFERTALADYMEHFKGGKKDSLKNNMQGHPEADTCIQFDPEDQ